MVITGLPGATFVCCAAFTTAKTRPVIPASCMMSSANMPAITLMRSLVYSEKGRSGVSGSSGVISGVAESPALAAARLNLRTSRRAASTACCGSAAGRCCEQAPHQHARQHAQARASPNPRGAARTLSACLRSRCAPAAISATVTTPSRSTSYSIRASRRSCGISESRNWPWLALP